MFTLSFTRARYEKARAFWAKQLGALAFVAGAAIITGGFFKYHWYVIAAGAAAWIAVEALATLVILVGHDPP